MLWTSAPQSSAYQPMAFALTLAGLFGILFIAWIAWSIWDYVKYQQSLKPSSDFLERMKATKKVQ